MNSLGLQRAAGLKNNATAMPGSDATQKRPRLPFDPVEVNVRAGAQFLRGYRAASRQKHEHNRGVSSCKIPPGSKVSKQQACAARLPDNRQLAADFLHSAMLKSKYSKVLDAVRSRYTVTTSGRKH
jgi:hypothetical protein